MINLDKNFPSVYDTMLNETIDTYKSVDKKIRLYYQASSTKSLSISTLAKISQDINSEIDQHNRRVRSKVPYARWLIIKMVFISK